MRERGLAGATSREITAAAGANLAAITYHFGSKDELLAEALFGELERRVAPALAAFGDDPDPDGGGATGQMLRAVQLLLEEFERSKRDAVVFREAGAYTKLRAHETGAEGGCALGGGKN